MVPIRYVIFNRWAIETRAADLVWQGLFGICCLLLLVLFPFLHDHVDDLGQPFHFLRNFQPHAMWVNTAANIDRDGKSSSQNFGYAGCVFNARWWCVECCWYCRLGWSALYNCQLCLIPQIILLEKKKTKQKTKQGNSNDQIREIRLARQVSCLIGAWGWVVRAVYYTSSRTGKRYMYSRFEPNNDAIPCPYSMVQENYIVYLKYGKKSQSRQTRYLHQASHRRSFPLVW